MSHSDSTLYLLILQESLADAEQFVSIMRNAGLPTRANHIKNLDELASRLREQSWDLLLVNHNDISYDAADVFQTIAELDKDISVIVLNEEYDSSQSTSLMKAGAKDVLPRNQSGHLVEATKREFTSLQNRRKVRQMEVKIRDSEHRSKLLLDTSQEAIAYISEGMHVYANSVYMERLGYEDIDDLTCVPLLDILGRDTQQAFRNFSKTFYESDKFEKVKNFECQLQTAAGDFIEGVMTLDEATYDSERCLQISFKDFLEETRHEVGLDGTRSSNKPNSRQLFMEQLNMAREKAINYSQQHALMYMMIDNFQKCSETVGIADTEELLNVFGDTITGQLGEHQTFARLSDGVFGLIMPSKQSVDAKDEAERYRAFIEAELFQVNDITVPMSASIGVAMITDNAPDIKEILTRAQVAAGAVTKDEATPNGNGVHLHQPNQQSALDDHGVAIEMIEAAIHENKFKLLFQPIINMRGESGEHYEAFVRMIDSKGEEVSPYHFLPPHGPSKVAHKIDKWVILETVKQLSQHRSNGHETRLFINLCAQTILEPGFSSWLKVALQAADLPGRSLVFQISEGYAITHVKQLIEFEKDLKEIDCMLSINQFGRALNPLNLLNHLSPTYIKLEGSYTQDFQGSEEQKQSAMELVNNLNQTDKKIIVPLVESAGVLSTLWQAGVHYIQGYYLQAPTSTMNYDFDEDA